MGRMMADLFLPGALAGLAIPLVAQFWLVARQKRWGAKRLSESRHAGWALVPLWLACAALFWLASAALADWAFAEGSAASRFTFGFGAGFGMTVLMPTYELWLRRHQPKDGGQKVEGRVERQE